MPLKRLGRLANAQAAATLYRAGTGLSAVVSTVVILNKSAADGVIRITNAIADAADSDDDVVLLETLKPGERLAVQEGWTLAATDLLRVTQPAGFATFAWGDES